MRISSNLPEKFVRAMQIFSHKNDEDPFLEVTPQ